MNAITADSRWRRAAWLGALGATPVIWFAWWIVALPAHTFNGPRFVLYDQGSYLYAIECARRGEALYTGFAWQYGPLALGWFAAWARVLGNTPLTLIIATAATTGLAWVAWVVLAARVLGAWRAWLGGTLLLLPMMTTPCVLSINDAPHSAIEALLLAGVAWMVYGACAQSDARWRWWLGVTLGLLQAVRFGPHAVAGAAAIGLVVLHEWRERGAPPGRAVWSTVAWVGAGYLALIGPLALLLQMPWTMLDELLWPIHMVKHYAATFSRRLPEIGSWGAVAQNVLPVLIALGLAAVALGRVAAKRRQPGTDRAAVYALAFPAIYFALALGFLLRSDYAVLGHLWIAMPALALAAVAGARVRWGVALALAPAAALAIMGAWAVARQEREWHAEPLTMPNGQALWFRASEREPFAQLGALLASRPRPLVPGATRRLAVFNGGGGLRYFFNTSRVGRHWWYLAEFVRPWEQDRVAAELRQHELLLAVTDVAAAPSPVLKIWTPLRPDLADAFLRRLRAPRAIPGIGYLLEIEPDPAGSPKP